MSNMLKRALTKTLNHFGLYTTQQYLEQVEEKGRVSEYARYLERAIDGMPDPAKPIVILADGACVRGISLVVGQSVVISPYAKNVYLENIRVQEKGD